MNYEECLDYLASLNTFGINLGLTRIERLLALMDHPERRFRSVHVTGTNGKGSTTAMVSAILCAAGIRTGMYTSPHLVDYTERMQINGKPVSREEFAAALSYTARFVEQMTAQGAEHPTQFEVLTAAAFYQFAAAGVDYAVIEVGLGGLLDSTNVIVPEVSVITNVTMEHADKCGPTILDIARHKAGIIKPGVPAVTAAEGEALTVIQNAAKREHAELLVLGRDFSAKALGQQVFKQMLCYQENGDREIQKFSLNLMGRHQILNAALAVRTARILAGKDPRIGEVAIAAGLDQVVWPARFEIIGSRPMMIVDGAHNPDGARVLRETLDGLFPGKPITFVLGILHDKDIDGILTNLIRPTDKVVVVRPESERAEEPASLASKVQAKQVECAEPPMRGVERALQLAGEKGTVCLTGSLYLVGHLRQFVLSRQNRGHRI